MARARDPYTVLGVDKKASAEEIKKAYRKLARQYHPDRNPDDAKAEERFKEVSEAHDLLLGPREARGLRPRRRASSAARGRQPVRAAAASTAGLRRHPLEPLRRRGGGGGRRGARAPGPERGRDLEAEIQISFDQAVHGAQVPLTIPVSERCATCSGTGARPGHEPERVPALRGPRHRVPGPGHVLDHPAVLALRRQRHGDRVAVPDLQRAPARRAASSACA